VLFTVAVMVTATGAAPSPELPASGATCAGE
jgi:hypothetical protein